MHTQQILANHNIGEVSSSFNFPIDNSLTIDELMEQLEYIYHNMDSSFKVNFSVGVILQNIETERYRYFRPHQNGSVFLQPLTISNADALEHVRAQLETLNLPDYLLRQRNNTKSVPVLLTNVLWITTKTDFLLGGKVDLPEYLKNKKSIISLNRNRATNKLYSDNLCIFRCLVCHRGLQHQMASSTNYFFNKWLMYKKNQCDAGEGQYWAEVTQNTFEGISFKELPEFESLFQVNVNVYNLEENEVATPLYRSCCKYRIEKKLDNMNLNVFENHFSYILDLRSYSKKYECETCGMLFKKSFNCLTHYKRCKLVTKYEYPGGYLQMRKGVFSLLEKLGIFVSREKRFMSYFCCFDFEAILEKVSNDTHDSMLKWVQKHSPISVSLCANIPGFTQPKCFIEKDLGLLLKEMCKYLTLIAEKLEVLCHEKWGFVFDKLNDLKDKWGITDDYGDEGEDDDDDDDDFNDFNDSDNEEQAQEIKTQKKSNKPKNFPKRLMARQIKEAEEKFQEYCTQLVVLGFNSAKYDLNLIKQQMAKIFNFESTAKFTVKRNNSYMCLSTEKFRFLDVSQYLAPGHDYSSFLKSFHVSEEKGFFPYEWFDSSTKLDFPALPEYDSFHSELKGGNTLNIEYDKWLKNNKKGPQPKSGYEIYLDIKALWKNKNMESFRDYLEYYNNLDVKPFVEAVGRMLQFYKERDIDLFKTSISVPGVARQLLFNASKTYGADFALFDEKNKDLYETFQRNLVGGPSVVFKRYLEGKNSKIRNSENICKSILGYDCNGLYLWALGQEMPTGPFIRRLSFDNFKPQKRDRFLSMFDWMTWVSLKEKIEIKHKFNNTQECRIGPYPVDGFCSETGTVFQYDGCYFHPHQNCVLFEKRDTKETGKWKKMREIRKLQSEQRNKFILSHGFKLRIMKECDWVEMIKSNEDLQIHIQNRYPKFLKKYPREVSETDILKSVQNELFFGCLEVDINVPDQWKTEPPNNTCLSPYEFFKEMSPIFCNANVPFEKIGDHMQKHAKEYNLGEKPRRLLVGGMSAKKIFLASQLLKWYLDFGMEVTRVYQCVEFTPEKCFAKFEKQVTEARRLGDLNSDCSLLASTMKLIGNSAFGSMIMDKTRHQNVKYVIGKTNACQMANKKQFRKLTELKDDMFEMELAKKKILLDLPIQIGYFILQLAKLRMLQFYYSFLDVYCDRDKWEMLQMDTDSCYIGASEDNLRAIIKPERLLEFDAQLLNNCHVTDINPSEFWFPRNCCPSHEKYDTRSPGLFKLEFKGTQAVALCSKTYAVKCVATGLSKFSSKGVNKSKVKEPLDTMKKVLETENPENVTNRGFRAYKNGIFTYTQEKKGFNYFYCKRVVLPDGIHTKPLDICLSPWES